MRSLVQIVESAIINHRMLNTGDTVVLAVSGGPDSVCLLHLMASLAGKWQWQIHVAHLHHGIRGADADRDARLVEDLARGMGYPFHLQHCDLPRLARARGLGLEEAGRHVRYQFFREIAVAVGAQAIATGHHADDQAETVLLNLVRGAGGTGLAGIQPLRCIEDRLQLIRPLLSVTRREIEHYLHETGARARHDLTNDELDQTRNRIRHQLLPCLREFNPRISESLARTAEIIRGDEEYLMQQVNGFIASHLIRRYGVISLPVASLICQPLALRRRILRRMVAHVSWEAKQSGAPDTGGNDHMSLSSGINVSYGMIEGILQMLESGKRSWTAPLPGGGMVRLSQGQLCFLISGGQAPRSWSRALRGDGQVALNEIECRLLIREVERPAGGWDQRLHLDQRLAGETLRLRTWRPGDRIRLGEASSKKLSDLFIDAKVPAPYRDRIPIIESAEGAIVAVTGLLVAPSFRPPADAPRALELQLLNTDRSKDCDHASRI